MRAEVYANMIIKGRRKLEEIPKEFRDEVERLLIEKGFPSSFFITIKEGI